MLILVCSHESASTGTGLVGCGTIAGVFPAGTLRESVQSEALAMRALRKSCMFTP